MSSLRKAQEWLWFGPPYWLRHPIKWLQYRLDWWPQRHIANQFDTEYWETLYEEEYSARMYGPPAGWFVMVWDEMRTGYHAPHFYGLFPDAASAKAWATEYKERFGDDYCVALPLLDRDFQQPNPFAGMRMADPYDVLGTAIEHADKAGDEVASTFFRDLKSRAEEEKGS